MAGDDGTTVGAIADAIEQTGQTLEAIWPYNDTLGSGTEPAPAAATSGTFNTADLFNVPLAHDGIEDNIEDALGAGLPVIVVIEVTAEFENPGADGEIDVPSLYVPVGDYHAVTAVGAATNVAGTARRLLIRNSWGPGWGAGGYGWLPYDYLVSFAGEAAAIDPRTLATR
jgi:C1A family cysteine protease